MKGPLSLLIVLVCELAAHAAPPTLTGLFPAGGRRGTTVEVQALGTFATWPVRTYLPGKGLTVTPAKEKGKLNIAIAADAAVGVHWLRLVDDEGASTLRPFLVGHLPEILEQEPNNDYSKPQALSALPVVINGRLDPRGDVDHFAVALKKGQTLVASLEANQTLGSPMDGVLQIVTPTGQVLADNHDYRGLDPQINFKVPADGTYLVRVFTFPSEPGTDISFSGGPGNIYRLTVTAGAFVEHAWPLAVERSALQPVELVGWNLPTLPPKVTPVNGEDEEIVIWHPDVANVARVRLEPHAVLTEPSTRDPKNVPLLPIPGTVSGQISSRDERDVYRFRGKKGQAILFQVESRSLGFPLDAVLRISDAKGTMLAELDDKEQKADPELAFTAPVDGEYQVEIRDLHGDSGLRYVYRLRALTQPDFQLTLENATFTAAPGKPLVIPVKIARTLGFNQPIAITVEGLPAGIICPPVQAAPGVAMVNLTLTPAKGSMHSPVHVIGKAGPLSRSAKAALPGLQATTPNLWMNVGK